MRVIGQLLGREREGRPTFTVLDLETTGLYPSTDRVVEVGLVQLDDQGAEVASWTTLVDPGRDVGPTSIHGISAGDVLGAPRFADIAPELLWWFGGTILAAHNARFDRSFLDAEFARVGLGEPIPSMLCTMNESNRLGLTFSRRLVDCCEELDLEARPSHCALDDARAAGAILAELLRVRGVRALEAPEPLARRVVEHPGVATRRRTDQRPPREGSGLGSLAARVSVPSLDVGDPATARSYLAVLDQVLEDRRVTADEVALLSHTAADYGLGTADLEAVHRGYVHGLWALAMADEVVTDAERREIEEIAGLLGVSSLEAAESIDGPTRPSEEVDLAGTSVCFTGDSVCSIGGRHLDRETAEALAAEHGLIVKTNVSRKLDILVLADVDSQSGKAKAARSAGIRLMDERAFWRALGVQVE